MAGADIPDNPIVHMAPHPIAHFAICGANIRIVGTTHTLDPEYVTCVDCLALL